MGNGMNRLLLIALLAFPLAAGCEANAETPGSGEDVAFKRFVIEHSEFEGAPELNGHNVVQIPVPAGSQIVSAVWDANWHPSWPEDCTYCAEYERQSDSTGKGLVFINYNDVLTLQSPGGSGMEVGGRFRVLIAY